MYKAIHEIQIDCKTLQIKAFYKCSKYSAQELFNYAPYI